MMGLSQKAVQWLNQGFSVFPCIDKKAVMKWEEFQTRYATTEEAIAWEFEYPRASLAIVCGKISGNLIIVDFDKAQPSDLGLNDDTFIVKTPRGGYHYYYRSAKGFKTGVNKPIPGVDIRAEGGYAISGDSEGYSIISDLPIAKLPAHLETLLLQFETVKSTTKLAPLREEGIGEGSRNETLFKKACALRGAGISPKDMLAYIEGINQTLCSPPLSKKEIITIVESASQYTPEKEKEDTFLIRMPHGYRKDNRGIWLVNTTTNDNGETEEELTLLCKEIFYPVARLEKLQSHGVKDSVANNKLVLMKEKNKEWKYISEAEAKNNSVVDFLNAWGIDAPSTKKTKIINYINDVIVANNIPTKFYSETLGFVDEDKIFVCDKDNPEIALLESNRKPFNGLYASGDYNVWKDKIDDLRKEFPVFRAILAASFAAPLLNLLNQRTFVLYVWGRTRRGKSAATKAALSIWGEPSKLYYTFDSTDNGMLTLAAIFKNLPLCFDELQSMGSNNKDCTARVYKLCNEQDRTRLTKDSTLMHQRSWRTIVITNGEQPLVTDLTTGGALNRMLEFEALPFGDYEEEQATELVKRISALHSLNTFGHAGKDFMSKVMQMGQAKIQEQYEKIVDEIKNSTSAASSQITMLAVLVLADRIAEEHVFKTKAVDLAKALDQYLRHEEQISDAKRIYDDLIAWINGNAGKFDLVSSSSGVSQGVFNGETFGSIEDGYCYILTHKFKDVCKQFGVDPGKVKRDLDKEGKLKTTMDGGKKRYDVVRRSTNGRARHIGIKLE